MFFVTSLLAYEYQSSFFMISESFWSKKYQSGWNNYYDNTHLFYLLCLCKRFSPQILLLINGQSREKSLSIFIFSRCCTTRVVFGKRHLALQEIRCTEVNMATGECDLQTKNSHFSNYDNLTRFVDLSTEFWCFSDSIITQGARV